jgi:hypothetical protein
MSLLKIGSVIRTLHKGVNDFVAYFTYFLTSSGELVSNAVEKYRFSRKLAHWNLPFTEGHKEICPLFSH